jgi:hypothetical protein
MPALRPCPPLVIAAGAHNVKLKRMLSEVNVQALVTRDAVLATMPVMKAAGAREMEYGVALDCLAQILRGEGLAMQVHNSLRIPLVNYGFAEPTDAQIVAFLNQLVTPMGIGGGKGGR